MKLRAAAALLVLLALAGVLSAPPPASVGPHAETEEFVEMARQMNIRNLVSAVYLGPRLVDTFIEVMVVVLVVFGMEFVTGRA